MNQQKINNPLPQKIPLTPTIVVFVAAAIFILINSFALASLIEDIDNSSGLSNVSLIFGFVFGAPFFWTGTVVALVSKSPGKILAYIKFSSVALMWALVCVCVIVSRL